MFYRGVSGPTYIVNDIHDIERDRRPPEEIPIPSSCLWRGHGVDGARSVGFMYAALVAEMSATGALVFHIMFDVRQAATPDHRAPGAVRSVPLLVCNGEAGRW
jgi:hypothetical protein